MFKSLKRFKLRMLRKMTFLPPVKYAKYSHEYYTGKKLDLKNPKEFNEKIKNADYPYVCLWCDENFYNIELAS